MKEIQTPEELYNLWALLAMTRDAIYRATKEELSQYGLTPIRAAALLLIHSLGNQATPPRIGKYLFRKRNSISELLVRMEQAGLVKRISIVPKKKFKRYELTEKGRGLYLKTTQLNTINHIFTSLPQEQRQQLQSSLQSLFDMAMKELNVDNDTPWSII